jgi:Protein of unknown function (DUF3485)
MSNQPKSKWMQPGFLIAAAILAAAAIGLNAAVAALRLTFEKAPVPIARQLTTIPDRFGDWVQVSKDEPLEKELQDALGTEQYIFRDYVNARLVSKEELAEFEGKNASERKNLLGRLQMEKPDAVVNLAVTYYTGLVDTVAHIPDRCYIADGFEPSEYETPSWDLGITHLGQPGPIPVRFINFEDQTTAGRVTRRVAYFFFTDGVYKGDPLGVRQTMQNLRYKHAFYSKIELMMVKGDHDTAQKTMINFLSSALPQVENCMPDWNRVEGAGVK